MEIKKINGDVCSPIGFKANGIHCGIRKNRTKKDLTLLYSEKMCSVGCTYTQNKVKGAPIDVTKENVADGYAKAMICNSGNANTCNADGIEIAKGMCKLVSEYLPVKESDVIVASTGVIGQKLSLEPIEKGMKELVEGLSVDGGNAACEGIMTTDTFEKKFAYTFIIDGKKCTLGAMAKGSGMIHPNMATMLAFITSDVAITPSLLQKCTSEVVEDTFNMVSVDGDTSTNDMLSVMANGCAGNTLIETENEDYETFKKALYAICVDISMNLAKDGEGATKLLECNVSNAPDKKTAKTVAKSVITSSLFKAAMFGCDANWGRVLCAIGYCEADFDIHKIDVTFVSDKGKVDVCKNGAGVEFSEDEALVVLKEDMIQININMNQGECNATAWGCDLTYDYVKINGDYRT